ncbi:myb/SANT-like DNA-binding domain-containing protein 3 [Planococcus citri]|uniref:myb/SANT-like DNA-binding domain-containing protein 3 n=1 Tax=Planococcus citri TaxID=170843 RepID=UPI0031F89BBB
MENIKGKMKRATNFSTAEENTLIRVLKRYKPIIENKSTGSNNNNLKKATWKKIEAEFNQLALGEFRDVSTLKNKYENIKKRAKQKYAEEKRHVAGTGGGPPLAVKFTETEHDIAEMLGPRMTGEDSHFDCDNEQTSAFHPVILDSYIQETEIDYNNNHANGYAEQVIDDVEEVEVHTQNTDNVGTGSDDAEFEAIRARQLLLRNEQLRSKNVTAPNTANTSDDPDFEAIRARKLIIRSEPLRSKNITAPNAANTVQNSQNSSALPKTSNKDTDISQSEYEEWNRKRQANKNKQKESNAGTQENSSKQSEFTKRRRIYEDQLSKWAGEKRTLIELQKKSFQEKHCLELQQKKDKHERILSKEEEEIELRIRLMLDEHHLKMKILQKQLDKDGSWQRMLIILIMNGCVFTVLAASVNYFYF